MRKYTALIAGFCLTLGGMRIAQGQTPPSGTTDLKQVTSNISAPMTALVATPKNSQTSFDNYLPSARFSATVGVLALVGPTGGYPNQTLPNSREPFVVSTLSYRLQAPNKRTFFQPEVFLEIGSNLDLRGPDDTDYKTYLDQNEAHEFIGLGVSNRVAVYLSGRTSFFAGAGAGIYDTVSFHLDNRNNGDSEEGTQPYDRETDYAAARLGFQFFTGLQFRRGFEIQAMLQDLGSADAYR